MTDGGNVDDWYSIRVWVGNIGRYNEGVLEGAWATLPMREADLDAFLRDRVGIDGVRYEEYKIDDYERPDWMPRGVIDQHTRVEDLNVLANVLAGLSGGREDAAKAGVWMEEMMPDGRSPLAFANLALQADGIPFLAYSAGSPYRSWNATANCVRRMRGRSACIWTWRPSAVTVPWTARCTPTGISTVPWTRMPIRNCTRVAS